MKKFLPKIIYCCVLATALGLGLFCLSNMALAISINLQQPFGSLQKTMEITNTSLIDYIVNLYKFGTGLVVAVAIVMVIIAGAQWITAAGDSGKIANAKDTIFKALIGMLIAIFSVFMLQTLNPATISLTGLDLEEIKPADSTTADTATGGALTSGGECTSTSQCATGLYCGKTSTQTGEPTGKCAPKVALRTPCDSASVLGGNASDSCLSGNCKYGKCVPATNTGTQGQFCNWADQCKGYSLSEGNALFCRCNTKGACTAQGTSEGTCQKKLLPGEDCAGMGIMKEYEDAACLSGDCLHMSTGKCDTF